MCHLEMSLETPAERGRVAPLLAISLGWVEWLFLMFSTGSKAAGRQSLY